MWRTERFPCLHVEVGFKFQLVQYIFFPQINAPNRHHPRRRNPRIRKKTATPAAGLVLVYNGDRRALGGREEALGAELRLPRLLQEGLRPRRAPPQVVRRRRRRLHRLRPRLRTAAQGPEGIQEVRARWSPHRRDAPWRRRRQVLQGPTRCTPGHRLRSSLRRRLWIGGGGALVPALQDGQAGCQPKVHLLVGGQGRRKVEKLSGVYLVQQLGKRMVPPLDL